MTAPIESHHNSINSIGFNVSHVSSFDSCNLSALTVVTFPKFDSCHLFLTVFTECVTKVLE